MDSGMGLDAAVDLLNRALDSLTVHRLTSCQGQLPLPCDNPAVYLMTVRWLEAGQWSEWAPEFGMCAACTARRRPECPADMDYRLRSNSHQASE